MNLSHRTDTFTDSVIRRMTRVCLKYNAINLSQGFPDFDPPKEICDRLAEVSHEDYHQYAITWGHRTLEKHWLINKRNAWVYLSILTRISL